MNIENDIYANYFFTSHINNLVMDETKPYSLFGYDNARIFKDISTDSFINNIFDDKNKLFKFVDYTFYSIYSKISKIHKILYVNGYFLDKNEYIDIIFKGGNTMSFFFDIIIKTLLDRYPEIFIKKINTMKEYLKSHNINLVNIDDLLNSESDETIKTFFDENKKKFKISDVDYTMYLNINDPIKYDIVKQLYNKVLINSLIEIRKFFDIYYLYIINGQTSNNSFMDILIDEYLPFNSNDDPYNKYINMIKKSIQSIKSSNMKNFYKISKKSPIVYFNNIENEFIEIFFENKVVNILILGSDKKNYFNKKIEYYNDIRNLRLVTIINEYLELLQIYFHMHKIEELQNLVKDLLIVSRKNISHHLNNKKRKILDSKMYNTQSINNFMNEITTKYNKENNPTIYNTKYLTSFDKKENIQKINLLRTNPEDNLFFNVDNYDDVDNEINFVKKNDTITYATNDIKIYDTNNSYENQYYHYISYNNSIYNSYEQYNRKFDLFRIKFNVRLTKPIISVDDKLKDKYDVPSEFVDVSIPAFQDINRKYFYNEVQEEGINILNSTFGLETYYWNTYSIHQLYDDLVKILFGPTIIPWYDGKYNKRIIRLLLLFSFYKIEKSVKNKESCQWICCLTDLLKLTNELYNYTNNSQDNIISLQSIKPIILGKLYNDKYNDEQANTILKYTFDNCLYKLNELGYNHIIKIDDYYEDFELIIRFIIFYSYSMKKNCFFDIFNNIRYITGLLPYEPDKIIVKDGIEYNIIDYNNLKFKELLKLIIETISVLIFVINETTSSCKFKDLSQCDIGKIKENCDYIKPIHYDFNSYYYKYFNDVIKNINLMNNGKKYYVKNIKKKIDI